MSTEKELFDDQDKFSEGHQEITKFFADKDSVLDFLWEILRFAPQKWNAEIETPIKAPNGLLIGFADCIIDLTDINNVNYKLLLEFKSSIKDYSSVLRQVKAYQSYLPKIDYTFVIVNDENFGTLIENERINEEFFELFDIFYQQKIILLSFFDFIHTFGYYDYQFAFGEIEDYDEVQMPLFLGGWNAEITDYNKSFCFDKKGDKIATDIEVSLLEKDPKYNKVIKFREVIILSYEDLKNIFSNDDSKWQELLPIKCKINTELRKDKKSLTAINTIIESIEINTKKYYTVDFDSIKKQIEGIDEKFTKQFDDKIKEKEKEWFNVIVPIKEAIRKKARIYARRWTSCIQITTSILILLPILFFMLNNKLIYIPIYGAIISLLIVVVRYIFGVRLEDISKNIQKRIFIKKLKRKINELNLNKIFEKQDIN